MTSMFQEGEGRDFVTEREKRERERERERERASERASERARERVCVCV
jgi:hypothetical protein